MVNVFVVHFFRTAAVAIYREVVGFLSDESGAEMQAPKRIRHRAVSTALLQPLLQVRLASTGLQKLDLIYCIKLVIVQNIGDEKRLEYEYLCWASSRLYRSRLLQVKNYFAGLRPTRIAHFCTAPNSKLSQKLRHVAKMLATISQHVPNFINICRMLAIRCPIRCHKNVA